jgi:hypothetical protein
METSMIEIGARVTAKFDISSDMIYGDGDSDVVIVPAWTEGEVLDVRGADFIVVCFKGVYEGKGRVYCELDWLDWPA